MEIVYNNGTAFFQLKSKDVFSNKDISKTITSDIISFSITEEFGKKVNGTLSLRDQSNYYSKIFRNGIEFEVSWGYKKWNPLIFKESISNPDLNNFASGGIRQGIRCYTETPSGNGSENGEMIYNITFYGNTIISGKEKRIFKGGTKYSVIKQLMEDLEIKDFIIDFNDMNDSINLDTQIIQYESSFKQLLDLAETYHAVFHIGYKTNGDKIGLFIANQKLDSQNVIDFIKNTTGITTNRKELYYNVPEKSNVSSFSWQHHIGENGQGDSISLQLVNGQMIPIRRIMEGQTVKTYRLNPNKIKIAFSNKSITEKIELEKQIWNETDFDKVKDKYFDAIEDKTAPQGMGYTINCKMVGDPTLSIPMRIIFKDQFPAPLQQYLDPVTEGTLNRDNFFIKQATHNINKTSYTTDIEIVDSFTVNGSAIQPIQGSVI